MVPTPMSRRRPCARPSLLLTLLLAAQAQAQSPATRRPDPLDARAPVPSVRYESSFAQFRRPGDEQPVAWREANDTVARIGGWRVYAREAQQPDPGAAQKPSAPAQAPAQTPAQTPAHAPAHAPAPAVKPTPPGHSGHRH